MREVLETAPVCSLKTRCKAGINSAPVLEALALLWLLSRTGCGLGGGTGDNKYYWTVLAADFTFLTVFSVYLWAHYPRSCGFVPHYMPGIMVGMVGMLPCAADFCYTAYTNREQIRNSYRSASASARNALK